VSEYWSGRCAGCGRRIKRAAIVGVYKPYSSQTQHAYLLCASCWSAVKAGAQARDAVQRAVERRIHTQAQIQ